MVEPSVLLIDGTHMKAGANKKKQWKELVARAAMVYEAQLREEVHAEQAALGKPPVEEDDDGESVSGSLRMRPIQPATGVELWWMWR